MSPSPASSHPCPGCHNQLPNRRDCICCSADGEVSGEEKKNLRLPGAILNPKFTITRRLYDKKPLFLEASLENPARRLKETSPPSKFLRELSKAQRIQFYKVSVVKVLQKNSTSSREELALLVQRGGKHICPWIAIPTCVLKNESIGSALITNSEFWITAWGVDEKSPRWQYPLDTEIISNSLYIPSPEYPDLPLLSISREAPNIQTSIYYRKLAFRVDIDSSIKYHSRFVLVVPTRILDGNSVSKPNSCPIERIDVKVLRKFGIGESDKDIWMVFQIPDINGDSAPHLLRPFSKIGPNPFVLACSIAPTIPEEKDKTLPRVPPKQEVVQTVAAVAAERQARESAERTIAAGYGPGPYSSIVNDDDQLNAYEAMFNGGWHESQAEARRGLCSNKPSSSHCLRRALLTGELPKCDNLPTEPDWEITNE